MAKESPRNDPVRAWEGRINDGEVARKIVEGVIEGFVLFAECDAELVQLGGGRGGGVARVRIVSPDDPWFSFFLTWARLQPLVGRCSLSTNLSGRSILTGFVRVKLQANDEAEDTHSTWVVDRISER